MAPDAADAKSILADEAHSRVAPKCFRIHHNPMIRPGGPAAITVTSKPVTPNLDVSSMLSGNPIVVPIMASSRLSLVFPWPFMTFPTLRLPKAENR